MLIVVIYQKNIIDELNLRLRWRRKSILMRIYC